MDLQQIYYIGELFGVVAVVASLLFVGVQMRQNARATRATSHHAITDAINQINLALAGNSDLARIFNRGIKDRSPLDEHESWQFDTVLLAYFHVFDTMYYQARVGAGDEDLLQAEEGGIAFLLSFPGIRDWWEENPFGYSVAFRNFVTSLYATGAETAGSLKIGQ